MRYGACETFEIRDGKITNESRVCKRIGYWIIANEDSTISKGYYDDNSREGVWKTYNKKSELVSESEYVSTPDKTYNVHYVKYKNSKRKKRILIFCFLHQKSHFYSRNNSIFCTHQNSYK